MTDVLYDASRHTLHRYSSQKIDTPNLHGTGCTLSSAIATFLAQGEALPCAVLRAKQYMDEAIERGVHLHIGHGNGPLGIFSDFLPCSEQNSLLSWRTTSTLGASPPSRSRVTPIINSNDDG